MKFIAIIVCLVIFATFSYAGIVPTDIAAKGKGIRKAEEKKEKADKDAYYGDKWEEMDKAFEKAIKDTGKKADNDK